MRIRFNIYIWIRSILVLPVIGLILMASPLSAQTDLKKILTEYADAMIEHGRDDSRYGEKTSPLFAVMLRRDTPTPEMLPYPQIPPLVEKTGTSEPGHRWLYYTGTNFINIPFLAGEKLHKLTVSGEDVMEHYGLYRMLYVLTDITEDSTYGNAADEALSWWYQNTQGPSGLFPWGEHLGWDFRYDYVTYHVPGHEDFNANPFHDYDGTPVENWVNEFVPITQLYQAFQHEPRIADLSSEILLKNLMELPLEEGESFTPLERFAFGCWREHIIDPESGGFNRHGDYFGRRWGVEGKWGGDGNYPRIIGQFFDYWSYTWMHSENPVVRDSLITIMETMVDYLESRKDENGIIHSFYGQVYKAAAGAYIASSRIKENNPVLGQKLTQFADTQITALYGVWPQGKDIPKMLTVWSATGREDLKPYLKQAVDDLYNDIAHNLTTASSFANHIRYMTIAFQIFQEDKYIKKAEEFVRAALLKMFDDYSPLPRINTADTLYSGNGTGYINFYHAPGGSDDLMWALALYAREAGWILEDKKPVAHAGSNQMVNAGDTVFLNGSASYSPQGGSVNYTWKVPGEITLNDSTIVNPTFLAPHVDSIRTFDISLVVSDGVLESDADIVYITVSPSVGINPESGKVISVFPNPCTDYITIDLGTNIQQSIKLDVLTMSGRLIDTFDINSTKTILELHQIPPGVYTLMFHFNNYRLIKKIIKMDLS